MKYFTFRPHNSDDLFHDFGIASNWIIEHNSMVYMSSTEIPGRNDGLRFDRHSGQGVVTSDCGIVVKSFVVGEGCPLTLKLPFLQVLGNAELRGGSFTLCTDMGFMVDGELDLYGGCLSFGLDITCNSETTIDKDYESEIPKFTIE